MTGILFLLGALAGAALQTLVAQVPGARVERVDSRSSPAVAGSNLAADVLRVIDGDTFEARVHVWPGVDITTRVRLRGIDAPEMKASCRDEAVRADAARLALQSLLAHGEVGLARVAPDKYGGRVVADAMTRSTPDVSAAMLEAGHARRYSGGRRKSWCE